MFFWREIQVCGKMFVIILYINLPKYCTEETFLRPA